MSRQIALIRLLDMEDWLRGVTFWDFAATCTPGQFKCGEVALTRLAPHLCYREFESADPLFVEFEAEGDKPVPYTAVRKLYARDEISRATLLARYPYWPCDCIPSAVTEAIETWKKEQLLADALLGGNRLCELCAYPFTPITPEENLAAWIDYVVLGTVEPAPNAPLVSRVLAYTRHKPMPQYKSPCSRAIGDIGIILSALSSPNATPYTERLRAWFKTNHAVETAPDFEVNALSFLQKMRLRPEACGGLTSLAPLALYMQWTASLADYKQADFAALKQHLAQVTAWGFGEEAAQALWLFGCRLHASNFAPEYIRWWQTRKGAHLPVSPFCLAEADLPTVEIPPSEAPKSEAQTPVEPPPKVVEPVAAPEIASLAPDSILSPADTPETTAAVPSAPAQAVGTYTTEVEKTEASTVNTTPSANDSPLPPLGETKEPQTTQENPENDKVPKGTAPKRKSMNKKSGGNRKTSNPSAKQTNAQPVTSTAPVSGENKVDNAHQDLSLAGDTDTIRGLQTVN